MKQAMLEVITVVALTGFQAGAVASEYLPEGQPGTGGAPSGTSIARSSDQGSYDAFGISAEDTDAADEASIANFPEANVGDGTVPVG